MFQQSNQKKTHFLRFVALLTNIIFVFSGGVLFPSEVLASNLKPITTSKDSYARLGLSSASAKLHEGGVPSGLGSSLEVIQGSSNKKLIHILDAHGIGEAQVSI